MSVKGTHDIKQSSRYTVAIIENAPARVKPIFNDEANETARAQFPRRLFSIIHLLGTAVIISDEDERDN